MPEDLKPNLHTAAVKLDALADKIEDALEGDEGALAWAKEIRSISLYLVPLRKQEGSAPATR